MILHDHGKPGTVVSDIMPVSPSHTKIKTRAPGFQILYTRVFLDEW